MYKSESLYKDKTKVREALLPIYLEGNMEKLELLDRLKISERHFYRIKQRYLKDKNIDHKLIGKKSNRRTDDSIVHKVIHLYKDKYAGIGFNYCHFAELLQIHHNIFISPSCIRSILLKAKITLPRKRNKRVFMRREPKPMFNQMVQLDGTFGYFLGDDKQYCLMHMVDDATKTSMAMLFNAECTHSALTLLHKWCLTYGIPKSIYSDRHSTYTVNDKQKLTIEEQLEGKTIRLSEFGIICERLDIKQIFAHSPQAKGRVERKHQLYKDRFIKELILYEIKTLDNANRFLLDKGGFIERLNAQFTIEPKVARPLCVLPTEDDLAQQFILINNRTVRNDYTISFKTEVYQITSVRNIRPKAKVEVRENLDGTINIYCNKVKLEYIKVEQYVKYEAAEKPRPELYLKQKHKPKDDHPYRSNYKPERKSKKTYDNGYFEFVAKHYG